MKLPKLALSLIFAALIFGALVLWVNARAAGRESMADAAFPATGQFVDVDGTRVHAFVAGTGPDLILIHGASGNLRDFTFSMMDKLSDRYRVIAFDRPGLGWTDPLATGNADPGAQAALLWKAAAKLGVTRPVVLGHSYGGAVALAWALDAPEKPAALVLVAGASMPWEGGIWWFHQFAGSAAGGLTIVPLTAAFVGSDMVDNAAAGIFAPDRVPAGYNAHIGGNLTLRRVTLQANSAQIARLKPFIVAMSARYPELALPVEIIHGDADVTVPLAVHGLPLSRVLPDAHLTILPGVGHMPHHAREADVIAAVDRASMRAGLR
jgi:pimeloyl-ACP methyl ester carboxylesterase